VRRWFTDNHIDYVRAFPPAVLGEEDDRPLFDPEPDGWWLEDWLAQLGWMRALGHEGGLFVAVGRRSLRSDIRVAQEILSDRESASTD
jgi:hypothetical protein